MNGQRPTNYDFVTSEIKARSVITEMAGKNNYGYRFTHRSYNGRLAIDQSKPNALIRRTNCRNCGAPLDGDCSYCGTRYL